MQNRTVLKYDKLIQRYKKEYLSYTRLLKRREKNHNFSITPIEYIKGKKKIYLVDEYKISSIIDFALQIKDYKLALKNLKWGYLNTTPYKRPFISNIEAAFIWFKNNKIAESENILRIAFSQQSRYLNLFNTEPLQRILKEDGSFNMLNYIESEIRLGRSIISNPEYSDFVDWSKQRFLHKYVT